jgi:serine/threonine protein kinase
MSVSWIQVRDILDEVLQVPTDDRSRYLDRACPQPEVRRYVESLIISYDKADEFLLQPATDLHIESWSEPGPPPLWIGRRIGAYLIEKEIGEGGMGTVFQAVRADDEYQKRVAIKLVKTGFASRFRDRTIQSRTSNPGRPRTCAHSSTARRWPHRSRISLPGHGVRRWRAH